MTKFKCMRFVFLAFGLSEFLTTSVRAQNPDRLSSKAEVNKKREPCQVCNFGGHACKLVQYNFGRKSLSNGYHYIATLPVGSCNATIRQSEVTKNVLALRSWSKKRFLLNGDWKFQISGSYTTKKDAFNYNSGTSKDGNWTTEEIVFTKQLSHAVEAFLVSQKENQGVVIKYWLPPTTSNSVREGDEKKKKNDQKNSATVKTPMAKAGTEKLTEEKSDGLAVREQNEGSANTGNSATASEDDGTENQEEDDDNQEDSSRPSWIGDLKNVMTLWLQRLTGMGTTMTDMNNTLTEGIRRANQRIDNTNADIATMKEDSECQQQFNNLRLIYYQGTAYATQEWRSDHSASMAFSNSENPRYPWASKSLPATVYFKFSSGKKKVRKISLQSRSESFNQSPQGFQVVASDNCHNWVTLVSVGRSGLNAKGQTRSWEIPCSKQDYYTCYGVKVFSAIDNHLTSIAKIEMFEVNS